MDHTPLSIVRRAGVMIATLDRPDKLNAINDALADALIGAVDAFRDDASARVLLIRAAGRYFSAGADLVEPQPPTPTTASGIREQHRRQTRGLSRLCDEMEAIEKPIVVAHQGPCLGAGLEVSLSADFRLAARGASYAFPEGRFGVLPAANGVSRATRLIGPHWARWMLMASMPVNAERALAIGLIHEVFEDAQFDAEVLAFCDYLSVQDAEHMGAAKLAIGLVADLGLAQARTVERMANSTLMLAPDFETRRMDHVRRSIGGPDGGGPVG